MHHVPGEHLARAVEVGGEVEPDPEVVLERDHRHPIVRPDPRQQAVAVLQQAQQPQRAVRLEALLHEEHDELPAVARREDGGEAGRGQGRPGGLDAIGPARAEPQRRLDVDRLAADTDLEVVGTEPRHRLALVADDPHVDHDARDVDPLDQRRLLLRGGSGHGGEHQRRRHSAAPSAHLVSHPAPTPRRPGATRCSPRAGSAGLSSRGATSAPRATASAAGRSTSCPACPPIVAYGSAWRPTNPARSLHRSTAQTPRPCSPRVGDAGSDHGRRGASPSATTRRRSGGCGSGRGSAPGRRGRASAWTAGSHPRR